MTRFTCVRQGVYEYTLNNERYQLTVEQDLCRLKVVPMPTNSKNASTKSSSVSPDVYNFDVIGYRSSRTYERCDKLPGYSLVFYSRATPKFTLVKGVKGSLNDVIRRIDDITTAFNNFNSSPTFPREMLKMTSIGRKDELTLDQILKHYVLHDSSRYTDNISADTMHDLWALGQLCELTENGMLRWKLPAIKANARRSISHVDAKFSDVIEYFEGPVDDPTDMTKYPGDIVYYSDGRNGSPSQIRVVVKGNTLDIPVDALAYLMPVDKLTRNSKQFFASWTASAIRRSLEGGKSLGGVDIVREFATIAAFKAPYNYLNDRVVGLLGIKTHIWGMLTLGYDEARLWRFVTFYCPQLVSSIRTAISNVQGTNSRNNTVEQKNLNSLDQFESMLNFVRTYMSPDTPWCDDVAAITFRALRKGMFEEYMAPKSKVQLIKTAFANIDQLKNKPGCAQDTLKLADGLRDAIALLGVEPSNDDLDSIQRAKKDVTERIESGKWMAALNASDRQKDLTTNYMVVTTGGRATNRRLSSKTKGMSGHAPQWLPTDRKATHKGRQRKLWRSAKDASVLAVKRVVKAADGTRRYRYEKV